MTPKRVEKVLTRHLDMKANDLTPGNIIHFISGTTIFKMYFHFKIKLTRA